jgi:hypothetical protein
MRIRSSMTTAFWLRSASVLTLLLALGHATGYPWTPDPGAESMAVVSRMQSVHFEVLGVQRSYWDFYVGFGHTITVWLLMLAILFWLLPAAAPDPRRARTVLAVMLAAFVAIVGLDWVYFFAAPLVLAIAIALCLALALGSVKAPAGRPGLRETAPPVGR